jgi:hypothetical protein
MLFYSFVEIQYLRRFPQIIPISAPLLPVMLFPSPRYDILFFLLRIEPKASYIKPPT